MRSKVILLLLFVVGTSGCGTIRHSIAVDKNHTPTEKIDISVGKVMNTSNESTEVDVVALFKVAIDNALKSSDFTQTREAGEQLIFTANIIEYKEGNAFKRWLVPGWGATLLTIRGEVKYSNGVQVADIDATREIASGGGFTIGAWEYIFNDVAKDIVLEMSESPLVY
jgi:uncharacterized protein YceK